MKFEKIRKYAEGELRKEVAEELANIAKYLTEKENKKVSEGKKTLADYTEKAKARVLKKSYAAAKLQKLESVESETRVLKQISITVEWKKSRMWGYNPTAEITFSYTDGTFERDTSGSIGGCGYDKESTATGQVLSENLSLLSELYARQEEIMDEWKNDSSIRRERLNYGAGHGVLPYFDGGVGFNCHRHILEKLGFTQISETNGKHFNVYVFQR